MKLVLRISLALVTIAYPFVVYIGLNHLDAPILAILLLVIALLRWYSPSAQMGPKWLWVCILLMIALWVWVFEQSEALKVYPVLVNLSFLVLFSWSLFHPPTVIERLARLTEPDLPDEGVKYTRKVTIVWCLFFVINGTAACVTGVWASNEVWVLYNGLVAYILMGLLFIVEYAVRLVVRSKYA